MPPARYPPPLTRKPITVLWKVLSFTASAGLFALCSLGSCAEAPTSTGTPAPTATTWPTAVPTAMPALDGFRIVGYVTDWDVVVDVIQFDKVTHINYAFLLPEPDGTVRDVANPWKLDQVVTQAHARGVKVLISVGGWGYDQQFETLAAKPETRAAFEAALLRYVKDHALDGVDIDWEYPTGDTSAQNYLALMQALHAGLQPQGKLLTAAVAALGDNGASILKEVFDEVDFLNLMVYDGPETNHASYGYALAALDYWAGRGLPPEKTVLGVPFYARPGEQTYRKLVDYDAAAANTDELDYYGQKVYYNGIPTMQQKVRLARQRASGLMIWALPQDTTDGTSLLNAIYHAALSRP
jgi:chitinase